MTSFILTKIVEKYNLYNHQKLNTQDIQEMSKDLKMDEKDLLTLFEVSQAAKNKCLKGIVCNFYINIYSTEELQKIKEKIRKELAQFSRANGKMIELFKQKYRISSKDMRNILNAKYQNYKKAEEQNKYINLKLTENKHDKKIEKIFEKDKQLCLKKISNSKKYNVSKKTIEQIVQEEKISIDKATEIFGIKKFRYKNLIAGKQLTVKVIDENKKKKIEKIKLDLKYIETNGERYYSQDEIALMSVIYEVSKDDMFFYLANGKTMYTTYSEALKNNPEGVWIGEKSRLSNNYIETNYKILNYYITQIAESVRFQYNCSYDDKEDFKSEVWENLIRTGGIYEKNLYYDSKFLNFTLIKNIKYIMMTYYKKKPYELSINLEYEGKEYENPKVFADNRYNPDMCFLEDTYSYLTQIEEIHANIVRDINKNSFFVIDHPKKFFTQIATKYNLTEEILEQTMSEIRAFILKNGLAKVDKNGRIISMLNVEDDN